LSFRDVEDLLADRGIIVLASADQDRMRPGVWMKRI
jgi:hypothetical protein